MEEKSMNVKKPFTAEMLETAWALSIAVMNKKKSQKQKRKH
jgi:hypothetical protein